MVSRLLVQLTQGGRRRVLARIEEAGGELWGQWEAATGVAEGERGDRCGGPGRKGEVSGAGAEALGRVLERGYQERRRP